MNPQFYIVLLSLLKLISGQSLFDSENVSVSSSVSVSTSSSRKASPGVNLPPKFLPGGDMDNFKIPEDTPIGTIVISIIIYLSILSYLLKFDHFQGVPIERWGPRGLQSCLQHQWWSPECCEEYRSCDSCQSSRSWNYARNWSHHHSNWYFLNIQFNINKY